MSNPVSFEWDWQRAEYLAAERDMWAQAPARPRAARRLLVLSAIGFTLFALAYWSRGILTPRTAVVLVLLTFGLPWLGARFGEWIAPRIRARRFARSCLPAYGRTAAALDGTGLTLRWQDSSVQLGWSTFTRFAETAEFVLLYQSPKSAIFLPKRAMQAEEVDTVRALAQGGMARRGIT